jgi:hypothetical protein
MKETAIIYFKILFWYFYRGTSVRIRVSVVSANLSTVFLCSGVYFVESGMVFTCERRVFNTSPSERVFPFSSIKATAQRQRNSQRHVKTLNWKLINEIKCAVGEVNFRVSKDKTLLTPLLTGKTTVHSEARMHYVALWAVTSNVVIVFWHCDAL